MKDWEIEHTLATGFPEINMSMGEDETALWFVGAMTSKAQERALHMTEEGYICVTLAISCIDDLNVSLWMGRSLLC